VRRGPKPKKAVRAAVDPWPGFAPPSDLDSETFREFARLSGELRAKGVIDKTDPRLVVATARTHSLIEKAAAELTAKGVKLTQTASNGTLMPHPMVAVLDKLHQRLRGLLADMGLSPKTARLTDPKSETQSNPWGDLLNVVG
jgi:P27 family predicted phage terminase small subunit